MGELASNKRIWDEHTVVNQVDKIQNGDLALIIDCGEDDFFLNVNKDFHDRLLGRKIDHDFITRPGEHNGKYWNNSIDYQILFFSKFFAGEYAFCHQLDNLLVGKLFVALVAEYG